jgi:hypothetical protein
MIVLTHLLMCLINTFLISVHSNHVIAMVKDSFEWKVRIEEDIFVMSFYAWLKAKMEKTPLYQTTLDLVKID